MSLSFPLCFSSSEILPLQVTVFVLDENDNTPYFDPSSYPISISESTEVGATVIRILAFDDDIGSNAQLSLNISSGNTSGKFWLQLCRLLA